MTGFNLIEEKWLPCLMLDGSLEELSLREILLNSTKVKELVGDSPPVTIALHRLLLAILHRALKGPRNYDEWNGYWNARTWNDSRKLEEYLANWKHRFDLFDADRPFFQVASIRDSVQEGAIIQLYFQGKNNATLFDHSTIGNPKPISPNEAARFLVTIQAFDFGGTKADGSAQTAPLLQSAISLVRGSDMFETLMLNFHAYNEDDGVPFEFRYRDDLPAWERVDETDAKVRYPQGYVDLLTWQARRILLQPAKNERGETVVKNTVIKRGFQFPQDYQRETQETMMAFKISKTSGFYSIGFTSNRALWRDCLSILQTVGNETYRPKMLTWLNELTYEGGLDRTREFPIEFYGLTADKGKLLFWQQDKFNVPLVYLDSAELMKCLRDAITFAEDVSKVLYSSGKCLATFLLAPRSNQKDQMQPDARDVSALVQSLATESKYWAGMESGFQRLLSKLPLAKEMAMRDWVRFVDAKAKRLVAETTNSLSGSANEQKAIIAAEGVFFRARAKLLKGTLIQWGYLPQDTFNGGQ